MYKGASYVDSREKVRGGGPEAEMCSHKSEEVSVAKQSG